MDFDVLAIGGHGVGAALRQGLKGLGFGAQALRGDGGRTVANDFRRLGQAAIGGEGDLERDGEGIGARYLLPARSDGAPQIVAYTYDAAGNRTQTTRHAGS